MFRNYFVHFCLRKTKFLFGTFSAYDLFCKGYLWGALHYQLPEETRAILFEDDTYAAYVALNRAFADNIIEEYKEGDMSEFVFATLILYWNLI